jgi:hypothetical protein
MRNFIISLIIVVLFSTSSLFAYASPPLPTPICHVEGVIKSANYIAAYDEPCVQTKSCPTDMEVQHPSRYYLQVVFSSVEYVSGETKFSKCEKLVALNTQSELLLNESDLKEGDNLSIGAKFEGEVRSVGNLFLDSYQILDSMTDEPEFYQQPNDLFAQNTIYFAAVAMVIFLLVIPFIVFTLVKRRKSK